MILESDIQAIGALLETAFKLLALQTKQGRNMMNHCFNPITQTITPLIRPVTPPSLQYCSRHVVLAAITLKDHAKAIHLPIPKVLAVSVSTVHLSDFLIKLEDLSRENYISHTYPAICLFNKGKVIIKVIPTGSEIDTNHPSYLTTFCEQGFLCCVYKNSETLHDLINQCIKDGGSFDSIFIWHVIHAVCSQLILINPRPQSKLKPSSIVFLAHDKIFVDIKEIDTDEEDITAFDMGSPEPIYDAPEVITHNNPTSRAFVWSLGCIMYELLSLEPAFFDIEGINPFQMYMNIVQGELPSFQNLGGSKQQSDLTLSCMQTNPELRPSLEYLMVISSHKISK